jgi:protein SCO1
VARAGARFGGASMNGRMRRALLVLFCAVPAWSGSAPAPDAALYSYHEQPGAALPLQTQLVDTDGRPVRLGDLPGGSPMVLVFGYFHCSSLCGVVRASILNAISAAQLKAGRDYTLAVISIDAGETPAQAREAKIADLAAFGGGEAAAPYHHYLTGTPQAIAAVTSAVGFRDRFDAPTRQFVHPAGVVFATASGRVSGYLLGVGYPPAAVRSVVERAGAGQIAAAGSPLLLICFHFDPTTGRYSLEVLKVLRLAGLVTLLTLGGTLFLLFRREQPSS